MDQALFHDLQHTLTEAGPAAAIDQLCAALRERKDYSGLFYALLMKKRFELGVSPIPTGPAQNLPAAVHESYEDAIREAGRLVGRFYLDEGDIPHAWMYFRMLGEPAPVAEALARISPSPEEDVQPLIDIAYNQGVHPRKGFDLVLDRFGICSSITLITGQEFPHPPDVRDYCIKRLVRALHQELCDRLRAEIVRREGSAPTGSTVRELLAGRDWLFEDDFYHIDVSHLGAVVQMSTLLAPGEELDMARELCAYGQRLSPRFRSEGVPPFEDQYRDYGVYLDILAGDRIEEGLAHFRAKLEKVDPQMPDPGPAEVLVNLLVRLGRPEEALAVAHRHLATVDHRQLACPSIADLCQQTNDYRTLAEVAREQGDAVHFVAGLIAAGQRKNPGPGAGK
ncbi:MAG: hypothetical protein JO112_09750 [Planctomycetes bacterium]|nr:hypothetical protein [Planctomycetota bacterium]